jgi:plasmid stability protein
MELKWCYYGAMDAAVSLSIKNVPPTLAKGLGERARRHHRSIQGELMHILEEAVRVPARGFDVMRLLRQAEALGLTTDADSADIIRELRDAR